MDAFISQRARLAWLSGSDLLEFQALGPISQIRRREGSVNNRTQSLHCAAFEGHRGEVGPSLT